MLPALLELELPDTPLDKGLAVELELLGATEELLGTATFNEEDETFLLDELATMKTEELLGAMDELL